MKNTKKYLTTGVALAIALFVSVHVVAMEKPVNPYLSRDQKKLVYWKITNMQMKIGMCDPKKILAPNVQEHCDYINQTLPKLEAIYYGNKTYTDEEIDNTING